MSYKPTEDGLTLKLDFFNEVTTIVLIDMLTIFSAANISRFDLESDFWFLAVLFLNLLVHLFFLVRAAVVGARSSCKRYCRKKKSTHLRGPEAATLEIDHLKETTFKQSNQSSPSCTV